MLSSKFAEIPMAKVGSELFELKGVLKSIFSRYGILMAFVSDTILP